ncbi:hypothetical protein C8R45DRAFT_1183951 [Mycena sanguinolenta]|nr:hypothetical protein C8R45DRAFT_1183951 [Mycena sanguinolenta]
MLRIPMLFETASLGEMPWTVRTSKSCSSGHITRQDELDLAKTSELRKRDKISSSSLTSQQAAATANMDAQPPPPSQKKAPRKGTKKAPAAAAVPRAHAQSTAEMDVNDDFPALLAPKAGPKRKMVHANDSDFEPEKAPTKRRRAPPIVAPRSPRPVRENRVQNPGAPDMPQKFRSSAEVSEMRRLRAQELRDSEAAHAKKVAEYAQMEIDEEHDDAEHDFLATNNLADLEKMDTAEFAALLASRMDDEVGDILDNFQPSDDVPYDQDVDPRYTGAIRAALQAVSDSDVAPASPEVHNLEPTRVVEPTKPTKKAKTTIREEVDAVKAKINLSKPYNKRLKKTQALYPTGLDTNWRDRIAPRAIPEAMILRFRLEAAARNQQVVGALEVSLGTIATESDPRQRLSRSDDEAEAPGPSSRPAAPKKRPVIKVEPTNRTKLQSQSNAVAQGWDSSWIPTLSHLLGTRINPFDVPDEEIEDAFLIVFPGIVYNLKAPGSKVMKKAFTVVSKYFQTAYPHATPDEAKVEIAKYVNNALRPTGSMLCSSPSHCSLKIICNIRFESKFIISVFAPFVKKTTNSSGEYGPLAAGLELAAAALEKVFLMYKTGEFVNDKANVSRENVGALVADYHANINNFSERKWNTILELCGAAVNTAPVVSAPSMENSRRVLCISSSPVKGDD